MPYGDPQKQRDYQKNWVKTKREKNKYSQRKYLQSIRKQVIELLGGKCVNCGCDNFNALEINHINGGGNEEKRHIGGKQFYLNILSGRRPRNDLEITCIVCNSLHKAQKIMNLNENWIVNWKRKI
jgi:5-methylcytosine-specific restriction endonuclease McrA